MTKEQRAEFRRKSRQAHKQGKDISLLAYNAETYAIAIKVKYNYNMTKGAI